jgi:hypothetical protein
MDKKFKNIPIEPDTKILFQNETNLCGYPVRYEIWSWDGYRAESFIFSNDDVSGQSDKEIDKLVIESGLIHEELGITLNRSDSKFVFVCFNFE